MRVVGDEEGDVGAKVLWLLPGGAADRAGIRVGDKVGVYVNNFKNSISRWISAW